MKNILIFLVFISSLFLGGEAFSQVPLSVSVKTASYTIPNGKYAKVTVNIQAGGAFSINAVTALGSTSNSWSVLGSSALKYGTGTWNGTNTSGMLFSGTGGSGTLSNAFSSSTGYNQDSIVATYTLPSGSIINGSGTWRAVVELYER